jgi:hypothetical protein
MLARRDFLTAAAMAPLALRAKSNGVRSCIFLVLTGGPSQLDTWDLKPDATSEVRGPFRPIQTNVQGMEISEIFPRMSKLADKYALIRSVYSDATPHLHEDGLRLIDAATEGFVALPGPIGFMGGSMDESDSYGSSPGPATRPRSFAENCARARQLVETGVRFVRVNMFDTVFHRTTWDSHGSRPFSTIRDYKDTVGPTFDAAYSTLLQDLSRSGLLDSTLVVAMGEFGRSPRINPSGGRDHWTRCQTVVMAGGGIQGGRVFGSSDATGSEPRDLPVSVARIMATVGEITGKRTGAEPVRELFARDYFAAA